MKIGIIKEGKTPPDSRVTLTPKQVAAINKRSDVQIVMQPSPSRSYSDDEYLSEGILLTDDLSDCDVLIGVKEVAEQANAAARRITRIFEDDAVRISQLKRAATMAHKVHQVMRQRPIVTVGLVMELCETTAPTAMNALSNLIELGIVREITGKERGRIFAYFKYLEILDEGTDPL